MSDNEEAESSEISAEDEEELIKQVKLRPVLWKFDNEDYRNAVKRNSAWREIAILLNNTELWCKVEWTKLRNWYNRRKKLLKGKTGQAAKRIESEAKFQSLRFIKDLPNCGKTASNLEVLESTQDDNLANVTENEDEELPDKNIESEITPSSSVNALREQKPRSATYSANRGRKRTMDPVDAELVKFLKTPKELQDEHYHYGLSLANQLREMTPAQASLARIKIETVLFEVRYSAEISLPPTPTMDQSEVQPNSPLQD